MTAQLPGVTTKRCPTCRTRPRMLDRSYCLECERARRNQNRKARRLARQQGIAPPPKRQRMRVDYEACNCGVRGCSGLTCDVVRVGA